MMIMKMTHIHIFMSLAISPASGPHVISPCMAGFWIHDDPCPDLRSRFKGLLSVDFAWPMSGSLQICWI